MKILFVAKHNSGDNLSKFELDKLFNQIKSGTIKVHHYSTPLLRFLKFIDKEGPVHSNLGKCWLWTSGTWGRGYGCIVIKGQRVKAHRYSYFVFNKVDPAEYKVCHKCDNPICVNPIHLFLGTDKDNLSDMARKGRADKGEDRHCAKLTEKIVKFVRSVHKPNDYKYGARALARKFGVSQPAMVNALRKKTWRHV